MKIFKRFILFFSISFVGLVFWAYFHLTELTALMTGKRLSLEQLFILLTYVVLPIIVIYSALLGISLFVARRSKDYSFLFILDALQSHFKYFLILSLIFVTPFLSGNLVEEHQWNVPIIQLFTMSLLIFILGLILFKVLNTYQSFATVRGTIRKNNWTYALSITLFIYISFFSFESIKYFYSKGSVDLAAFSQFVSNIKNSGYTVHGIPVKLWSIHFMPGLYIFSFTSFLKQLIAVPLFLNIFQIITVASGAIPIYLMAQKKFNLNIVSFFLALSYLGYFPLLFVLLVGFEMDTIAVVSVIWSLYYFEIDRKIKANLFLLLAILFKEELALAAISIHIWRYWKREGTFASSLKYVGAFLLYYIGAKYVVLTNASKELSLFSTFYGGLGTSLTSAVTNVIKSPQLLIYSLFSEKKLIQLILVALPFMFLPLAVVDFLIVAFPFLLLLFLSDFASNALVFYHVVVWLIVPLLVGLFSFLEKVNLKSNKYVISLSFSLVLTTILTNIMWGPFGYSVPPLYRRISSPASNSVIVGKLLNRVPEKASVAVPMNWLMNTFSTRKHLYPYPPMYKSGPKYTYSVDYLLIDTQTLANNPYQIQYLNEEQGYSVDTVINGIYILKKNLKKNNYIQNTEFSKIQLKSFKKQHVRMNSESLSANDFNQIAVIEKSIDTSKYFPPIKKETDYVFYAIIPSIYLGPGCNVKVLLQKEGHGFEDISNNIYVSGINNKGLINWPLAIDQQNISKGINFKIRLLLSANSLIADKVELCNLSEFQLLRVYSTINVTNDNKAGILITKY